MSQTLANNAHKTIVINLYGGSGVGKSTAAAAIFSELKMLGWHCELVREYIKSWAWAGMTPSGYDQVYIFGTQARIESQLYGKLDVLVTDSPLLLCGFYEGWHLRRKITLPSILEFMKYAEENGVMYLHFWLERYKVFDPRGRYESEEGSKRVHVAMKQFLIDLGLPIITVMVDDRERAAHIIKEMELKKLERDSGTAHLASTTEAMAGAAAAAATEAVMSAAMIESDK